jgi:multicomponent Na+:H+ antiporter subunit D
VAAGYYGMALWAVLVSIVTLASFMKVQKYAFFGELPKPWKEVREVAPAMRLAMILLAVLCLAMSVLAIPRWRGRIIDYAGGSLVAREDYVESVLGRADLVRQQQGTTRMVER